MRNAFKSIRLPPFRLCLSLLVLIFTSCDREWPDDFCPCTHGGTIDGWENSQDTTIINKKDSLGGFSITVDEWKDSVTLNIRL